MNKEKLKEVGYFIGYTGGIVVFVCIVGLVVAVILSIIGYIV